MSYTNTINSTRTPEHHIASGNAVNAQGNTITGRALKKVANFIGMDDVHDQSASPRGYVSTDLELELAARRSAFNETASLEAAELKRRMDNDLESSTAKDGARKVADTMEAWWKSENKLRSAHDRVESRRFLKHLHNQMNEIERAELDRRRADPLGESLRQSVAKELSAAVSSGLASPHLKPATASLKGYVPEPIRQTISKATEVAASAAGSVWGSVFQIGQFAARAAQFLGGRAAVKAQNLEQTVATKAPAILAEAADKVAHTAGDLVQTLGENLGDALFSEPTLSWSQLDALENEERAHREGLNLLDQFSLASFTSSLIKAKAEGKTVGGNSRSFNTAILEEMERERRIAQNKANPTARLNAKRAAGLIMTHRRQMLCKQTAQNKAQEVRAASPQPTRNQVLFAMPTTIPQAKRVIPQVANKRYNYVREKSRDNLTSQQAAM